MRPQVVLTGHRIYVITCAESCTFFLITTKTHAHHKQRHLKINPQLWNITSTNWVQDKHRNVRKLLGLSVMFLARCNHTGPVVIALVMS